MNVSASPISPDTSPLAALLDTLCSLGVSFYLSDGRLKLRGNAESITPELQATVRTHKPELLAICGRRELAGKISETITRLRCEDPAPPKTRANGVRYIEQQITRLTAECDVFDAAGEPTGWADASDPFADVALAALRTDLAEMIAEGNPYPLGPLSDNPFSMDPPRLCNGRLA